VTASLQPLAFILRVHPVGGLGDYAPWACTVIARGDIAFLAGAPGDAPTGAMDDIARVLQAAGFRRVGWERRKAGSPVREVGPYDIARWLTRRGGGD
jgi:hypothetical protein